MKQSQKFCEFCGAPLRKRAGEEMKDFSKRITCGRKCASKLCAQRRVAQLKEKDPYYFIRKKADTQKDVQVDPKLVEAMRRLMMWI